MLRRAHLQNASSFLVSRGVNAVLVLVQLALVGRLYGTDQASKFFVFWTVVWAASIGIRFGFDQLLPKHAANATLRGQVTALSGYRRVATYSIPVVAALIVPLLLVVLPEAGLGVAFAALPFVLVGAIGWGSIYLVSALVKGYGHAGLSGWVGGPTAIALPTVMVPAAHALNADSWYLLGALSSLALFASGALGVALVSRVIGWERTSAVLFGRSSGPLDPDTWSTGSLTALAEINVYLPVWIAGALALSASDVAALYAALRVAAAFSWIFGSVVAVLTPLLAASLARREYARLRRLLWRSALIGVGATAPLALVGVLLAGQLLSIFDPSYRDYGYLLAILIGGRLFDAAVGAVGEALILGDRSSWELRNQILSTTSLLIVALALEPAIGVIALAIASATSVVTANIARVLEVRWLMQNHWQDSAGATGAA